MPRYFFDVTDIKQYLKTHTTISGIQRVSLEVIKQTVQREGPDQVHLCLWDGRKRSYTALSSDFLTGMAGFDVDLLSAVLFDRPARPAGSTPTVLRRYRNRPVKYQLHRMLAHLQARRGNESYFAKRGSSIAEWRGAPAQTQTVTAPPLTRRPVEEILTAGDQVIVLGATWGMSGFDNHLQHLKDHHGARISMQVHDLIPLVMPQHLVTEFSLEFYRWLEKSTQYCAGYFVAAQNTRKDLEHFMKEVGQQRPITVIPFARKLETAAPLPVDASLKDQSKHLQDIPQAIRNTTKVPYVLVVGTLESRKNLWRLVQAWDRLTQDPDLEMPKLVFAGRMGWFNEDMMEWMRASGNLRGWVQFVDRPNDDELAYLYRNCLFTATVSLYEGWGLPIGESLGFGKTAVVADNSAMPEVGGDLVEYCDAGSISSITAACRKLIADPSHRQALEARIADTDLRGWDDVAADYIAALTGD
jgi:glycosyltransferase involved in cell wall biosynthesis